MSEKTDKEIIHEMFKRANLEEKTREMGENPDVAIAVEGGYIGFYSVLAFKEDGSLKSVGAYE
jgi:hypothetical protein